MTDTIPIPLNKLTVSDDNVRKTATAEGIAEMAASIKAHGLLHNLVVKKDGKKYGIVDGSRRFKALIQLAEAGHISDNLPISCKVDDSEIDGKELSLAANTLREQMHPADEFEAFRDMANNGSSTADIAARFGCDEAHVTRLLKLGRVSPVILKAYRADELKLDEVMAFTLTDDHARQELLLGDMASHQGAREIRKALTQGELPVTDKRVKYVTLAAYEKAGGPVKQDLFVDFGNGGYVTDTALLDKLATEKLERAARTVAKEGWKWTAVHLDFEYAAEQEYHQLQAEQVPLTAADQKKYEKLVAKHDKLYEEWDGDSPQPAELKALDEQIDEIDDRECVWDPDQIAIAGAVVTIGHDGKAEIKRGLVKPEDMPKKNGKSRKAAAAEDADAEAGNAAMSAALIESLTAHKSAAIAASLMASPDAALAEVVYTMVLDVFDYHRSTALRISATAQSLNRVEGSTAFEHVEAARKGWTKKIPKDAGKVRAWCLKQKRNTLLELLAFCAASSVNAIQTKTDRDDGYRMPHAEDLASTIGLDMKAWFTPTADNYFSKVGKPQILEAIAEAKGHPHAPALEKLKKGELAKEAERLTAGTGWLPKPLRPAV